MPTSDIGGAIGSMAPLISFDTIFDIGVGLIQLIYQEYLDPAVFDVSKFHQKLIKVIATLYYRTSENPLVPFAHPDIDVSILDEYFDQFMAECYDKILENCVTTEMENVLVSFKTNKEIHPTILYRDDRELSLIQNQDTLKDITTVKIFDLTKKQKLSYSQYYLRRLQDATPFLDTINKTFYFCNCPLNLTETQDDLEIESGIVPKILANRNHINIYNIYNESLLRSVREE